MRYKRGNVIISIYQLNGFGKNPSLWIGTEKPNQMLKVASFGNADKAEQFCKWLDYLLGEKDDPPEEAEAERRAYMDSEEAETKAHEAYETAFDIYDYQEKER